MTILDHKDIILEALYDYRKWWDEEDDEDKEREESIDNAIKFIEALE